MGTTIVEENGFRRPPARNVLETHEFTCSACDKKLLSIQVVREDPAKFRFRVDCPYCGDFSMPKEIVGQTVILNNGRVCLASPEVSDADEMVYLRTYLTPEAK